MRLPCPPVSASPQLVAGWQRYVAAIEVHEQGHVNLAVEAGRTVLVQLDGLGPVSAIERLRDVAADAANGAVSAVREREGAYDKDSRHGVLQGAVLAEAP